MLGEAYVGTTRRITAGDLTQVNADGSKTPITAGAVVTIVILNPDRLTNFSSDTATVTGDDWSILKDMPNVAGLYPVHFTAVYNGATEKWEDFIRVKGF